jgi:hypothetical protein
MSLYHRGHVEVHLQGVDCRVLEDIVRTFGVAIEQTAKGLFIVADQFEELDASSAVHELAVKIAAAIELGNSNSPAVKFDLAA